MDDNIGVVTVRDFNSRVSDFQDHGVSGPAGVTIDTAAEAIRRGSGRPVQVVRRLDDLASELVRVARAGDAVITLGAGSIGTVPRQLVEALGARKEGG